MGVFSEPYEIASRPLKWEWVGRKTEKGIMGSRWRAARARAYVRVRVRACARACVCVA